ncbi:MAG TPA: hypothetical protein VKV29_14040 [Chthonomonas sp.]|jgi:hypothetical protein|uniref:hypothetical protein n=1 Tax=Chthonomonas sp. TaxID=2282153 RepID=UPI002B4B0127|nr:hypothetical protein [Chthonomonas sp.]HLH81388.1 hypothetical protein [Chthonomonas sp.]
MEIHIKVLAWLHITISALYVLPGIALFLFLLFVGAGTGALVHDALPAYVLGGMGVFLGAFLLIFGLPGLILGYGLLTERSWSRPLGIVFSLFDLLNFPLGTILGVYGLVVLFNEEASLILSK